MTTESVPGVLTFGDTSATAGSALFTTTFTPPCCDAPSDPLHDRCKPAPTVQPLMLIPGADTVTVLDALVVVVNPGIVAETVVVPGVSGSNATPPTDDALSPICTVTVPPVSADVTN